MQKDIATPNVTRSKLMCSATMSHRELQLKITTALNVLTLVNNATPGIDIKL